MAKERRRYPRLSKTIPLKISSSEFDIVTQSKNLSCIGAYCSIDKPIPLLTKLKITLLLPEKEKAPKKEVSKKVNCIGVVVRTEKARQEDLYNIAIFFEQIREKERLKLEDYINHHLTSKANNP